METKQLQFTFFFLFFFLTAFTEAEKVGGSYRHRHGSSTVKLFVFGDSYADTGNSPKFFASSWNDPFGITFPGKPAGRFSDGRVLTDYIASFLGIRSPPPYKLRKLGKNLQKYGMNFAHGGTGVFTTLVNEPNMTTQINFFQQILEEKVYTEHDLNSSIALVSLGGNDYATFMAHNGTLQGYPAAFTTSVINQLALNLKRIHGLGVPKIAITAMEPMGCLPAITARSLYKNCSQTENEVTKFHNQMLQQAVHKLNNGSITNSSGFVILDLYRAFMSVLKIQENHSGNSEFENPLKPCCVGMVKGTSCGSIDENGSKKYILCNNPKVSFFWDAIHPTQQGWHTVYSSLRSSLKNLYH